MYASSFPDFRSGIWPTAESYSTHSKFTPLAKDIQLKVAKDIFSCAIGAMPAQEFLDRFLPRALKVNTEADEDFFADLPNGCHETDMYEPFVSFYLC